MRSDQLTRTLLQFTPFECSVHISRNAFWWIPRGTDHTVAIAACKIDEIAGQDLVNGSCGVC